MNQRIDFSKLGGFPATQYTLDYMQGSYRNAFTALAIMLGDKVIVSGVDLVGGQYTAGWISINGELMPFLGGAAQATFIIEETNETRVFQNGQTIPVYFKRVARFGSGTTNYNFSDLKRMGTVISTVDLLAAHMADTSNPHAVTKAQVGLSNLPNAKSDDPLLNDTNVLATTAATAALANTLGRILYVGSVSVGDISSDKIQTVTHNQNITGGYVVTGSLVSQGSNWNDDNDVFWMVRDKQANTFQLLTKEVTGAFNVLSFDYVLIKI